MNVADELERLAKLHVAEAITDQEFARAKSRLLSAGPTSRLAWNGLRRQSSRTFFGLPLWAVAVGPDWERGELRGHARGIFAFGDIATGCFACGGLARGVIAVGGAAVGLVAMGGGAAGLLLAMGGAAVGGVALGGAAVGVVAVGGAAYGYYVLGGAAGGVHTLSAAQQDPAALDFFQRYLPWLAKLVHR